MVFSDPAFWRAGAISTITIMSVVLIMLTIDSLAAISPGGSHVPPYTVINQHIDGIEQDMFAADGGHCFFPAVIGIEIDSVAMNDGVAQLCRSAYGSVLGEVFLNGGNGRIFDVPGGGEMWLTGTEIDDVDALAA